MEFLAARASLTSSDPSAAWSGRITFDTPRHRETWKLPFAYPRLNGLPQWTVIDKAARYTLADSNAASTREVGGDELIEGLPVELRSGTRTLLWKLRRVAP